VSNNCADFAKDVINFYYPKALRRSVVADAGITTPKQMAKTLVKFNARHPELQFSRIVIPQVPGSLPAVRPCTASSNRSSSRRSTLCQVWW